MPLIRSLFLRGLGIIYLIAFVSLWFQVDGLIGSHGILPAAELIQLVRERLGVRWDLFPTLVWINSSNGFLNFLCGAGVFFSVILIAGFVPSLALFLLWVCYLSLVVVGQEFLSFQWDNLLLETGFLSIFLAGAPSGAEGGYPHLSKKRRLRWPPGPRARACLSQIARFSLSLSGERAVIWLLRLLLFKLMFESGSVKLLSGDPTWRNLTALHFHYETQPLPTWIGWYTHQLPSWFQRFSVGVVFFIELVVPFTIFAPRRIRLVGCGLLVFLQTLIFLTGNYCFFNLLTVLLCLMLLDDRVIRWILKQVPGAILRNRCAGASENESEKSDEDPDLEFDGRKTLKFEVLRRFCRMSRTSGRWLRKIALGTLLVLTTLQTTGLFLGRRNLPFPVQQVLHLVAPFRTINNYGLFAVMTTNRREIVVEGSDDGQTWLPYEFKYKPGDLAKRPSFVEPHQPRLDWQLWFAALGDCRDNPWFSRFMKRLLEGSPEVLKLLDKNPFPEKPPRSIRAVLYQYHFTDLTTKRAWGEWWRREKIGPYCKAP